ncbi:DUF4258 domain-containing protein [Flavobacterium amniphilum]|uniref:DUF4258 domain-containing protein n=1 Tax=Flavobacterium amniphilum TaxID=1834035 RepID=UPI00202A0800|nr:DUF4258 domain-containing protein [Flavobacterium amniphilum]MCL9806687.1 DUF4258 domain-containing protein [Flavobacterium amniphilum]
MKLRYRLSYFMIGFAISSFAVVAILNQKQTRCTYFPNDRVLSNIKSKPFSISKEASSVLAESWIDSVDVKNTLQFGEVDFDRSNIGYKNGKLYTITGKTMQNEPLELVIENYDDKAILKEIRKIKK